MATLTLEQVKAQVGGDTKTAFMADVAKAIDGKAPLIGQRVYTAESIEQADVDKANEDFGGELPKGEPSKVGNRSGAQKFAAHCLLNAAARLTKTNPIKKGEGNPQGWVGTNPIKK